jgi:ribosomal protein S12 methylthiotransferase accessory factor
VQIEMDDRTREGLELTNWHATATIRGDDGSVVQGFAAACSPDVARTVATIELAERWAQFGTAQTQIVARDAYARLGGQPLGPEALGCYSGAQYSTPGFPFARFEEAELEWVAVSSLRTRERRLVPVEFVHPRNVAGRRPVVAETSSGTAAHTDIKVATLSAVCEVIERDAALLLWHRQPKTAVTPIARTPDGPARDALLQMRADGAVVLVLRLTSDIDCPVFMTCAFKPRRRFLYGLGCHPDESIAFEAAVRELAHRAAASTGASPEGPAGAASLSRVRSPLDHLALFDGGPLHELVRGLFDHVAAPPDEPVVRQLESNQQPGPDSDIDSRLEWVIAALDAAGFEAFTCDITPAILEEAGLRVVRAFVPGLVPLYFGVDRVRLGCERLTGTWSPGRLATLLPHFLA